MGSDVNASPGRGRPRDPDLDERILEQVLALLGSHGYAGLTLASCPRAALTAPPRRDPFRAARNSAAG